MNLTITAKRSRRIGNHKNTHTIYLPTIDLVLCQRSIQFHIAWCALDASPQYQPHQPKIAHLLFDLGCHEPSRSVSFVFGQRLPYETLGGDDVTGAEFKACPTLVERDVVWTLLYARSEQSMQQCNNMIHEWIYISLTQTERMQEIYSMITTYNLASLMLPFQLSSVPMKLIIDICRYHILNVLSTT